MSLSLALIVACIVVGAAVTAAGMVFLAADIRDRKRAASVGFIPNLGHVHPPLEAEKRGGQSSQPAAPPR